MKILFVLNIGFDCDGPSVHLLKSVIEATLQKGHICHVILKKTTKKEKTGLEDLIEKYNTLTTTFISDITEEKRGFVKRYLVDCLYTFKCKKVYKNNKYDAVFLQSCNVGWLFIRGLARLKCPVIFNVQDIFPQNLMYSGQLPFSKVMYPLFLYLQKVAYDNSTRLITISEDMKKTLVEQGVNQEKIDVVYNWSYSDNCIRLSDMDAEQIYDIKANPKKINVVYAGNIGKMQNVELVANTARIYETDKTINYYIIGDGANKECIKKIVEGLSNVVLLPMQDAIYAESIYAQADINVIPLVKGGIKTAFPSKTATILRTGKSVIFCIDEGSMFEELAKDIRNIYIASNENPESLYQTICKIRDDKIKNTMPDDVDITSFFSIENAKRYVEIIEKSVKINRNL